MPKDKELIITIDEASYNGKILIFEDLLTSKYNNYYDKLDYDETATDTLFLLDKFLKKIQIEVEQNGQGSNKRKFYLHNKRDQTPHYNITPELYEANKDILKTLPIVLFIRKPNIDVPSYSEDYDDYNPQEDKRLQQLLKYVDYIREHPEDEGNQ